MSETPQNLKGVTNRPLINAIPVSNYILSILHIIIGMRNSLVDEFLEWIEERIEVLDMRQVQAQNTCMHATVLHETAFAECESWLENDGILLNDKEIDKQHLKITLNENVKLCYLYLISIYTCNLLTYLLPYLFYRLKI
jgi:hypothetical protein